MLSQGRSNAMPNLPLLGINVARVNFTGLPQGVQTPSFLWQTKIFSPIFLLDFRPKVCLWGKSWFWFLSLQHFSYSAHFSLGYLDNFSDGVWKMQYLIGENQIRWKTFTVILTHFLSYLYSRLRYNYSIEFSVLKAVIQCMRWWSGLVMSEDDKIYAELLTNAVKGRLRWLFPPARNEVNSRRLRRAHCR